MKNLLADLLQIETWLWIIVSFGWAAIIAYTVGVLTGIIPAMPWGAS